MQNCRACDEEVQLSSAVHLFTPRVSVFVKQIELITNLVLPNLPELPAYICAKCRQNLVQAVAFRTRCIKTQEKYDQLPMMKIPAVDSLDPLSTEGEPTLVDVKVEIKEEHDEPVNHDDALSEVSFEHVSEGVQNVDSDYDENSHEDDETWQQQLQLELDTVGKCDNSSEPAENQSKKYKQTNELSVCDQCGKSIKKRNLELHLLRHTGIKTHECKLCKAKFYTDYLLELHTRKRHRTQEQIDADNATQALYKAFTQANAASEKTSINIKRHMNTDDHNLEDEGDPGKELRLYMHEVEENVQVGKAKKKKLNMSCEQCGKSFKNNRDLNLHVLRHSGKKNFQCDQCQAKFYTDHLLKMHIKSHTDPFKCRYCEETFGYNSSRNRHERLHTNERPFECKFCDMRFVCASSLKDHQVRHTGERNYHCKVCDLHFLMNKQLFSHTRSKAHKEALLKLKDNLDLSAKDKIPEAPLNML